MDADLSTLHAPEAAAEVVDEGCRRVRERGEIDIVRSATCVDKATSAWQFVERPILAVRQSSDIRLYDQSERLGMLNGWMRRASVGIMPEGTPPLAVRVA
jgi:hypothetical protein